ncbi:MAG: excinuclease ABC subunit C [Chloroflexi bacterium RBG_16_50_9]|nr:MAG: excinuclease ABC subunit C [Chloroflexi bacterium RBG_16_50_9]
MNSTLIKEQLNKLPDSPGVYLMRDAGGNILYIGKAASLHHRVRSYFNAVNKLTPKLQRMVAQVADIDFLIAASEQEALILELNLIKQYHPHFNVRLKDDKTFPYLKISINEAWPKIYVTRRLEQDGGRYFGPFASARSVRQTLRVLQGIFPFRICHREISGKPGRACLEYHLGRCLAPCIGAVSHGDYAEVIKEVILFLEGKQDRVVRELRDKMNRAAEALDFERAARIRNQIQAIQRVIEGQKIATMVSGEQDVVAFIQDRDMAYVQVFFVRRQKLIGRESFLLQGTRQEEPQQIMTSFVKQFYASSPSVPPLLLLQYPVEDSPVILAWLQSKRGARMEIQVPRRGRKKQLMDIVVENARQGFEQLKIKEMATPEALDAALEELARELGLKSLPVRMEAYDISNIQGKSAVGSMVVFEKGKPKTAHYRRFKIKAVAGANDYAMIQEVLQRRFRHVLRVENSTTDTWAIMPDLVLIDGGKGQLNAALSALHDAGSSVPVASLAKENEEIFVPRRKEPIVLPSSSPGLQLLQRLRDEAHRFAISYYTRVHHRQTFTSNLDGIPGIGPKRKRALLRQFGSIQRIKEASFDELIAATGMAQSQAKKVKEYL